MATLSGLSASGNGERRKKPVVTYGKTTRNATFSPANVGSFFDASKSTTSTSRLKRPTAALAKSTKEAADEFDIPLSEEESQPRPRKTPKPSLKPVKTALRPSQHSNGAGQDSKSQEEHEAPSPSPQRKRKRTASRVVKPSTARPTVSAQRKQEPEITEIEVGNEATAPRRSKRHATARASVTPSPVSPQVNRSLDAPVCPVSPPFQSPGSPADSSRLSVTPRQSKLWHELLLSDLPEAETHDPLSLAVSLASPVRPLDHPSVQTSSSDMLHMPTKRTARIVDRLKRHASFAQNSDCSDGNSDDGIQDCEETCESQPSRRSADSQTIRGPQATKVSQTQNPSQVSQSSFSQGISGKRVTYARSRTYLEDSLEDALLSDLSSIIIPERPSATMRRTGASSATRTKSKLDLEHDSDEGASQGIRSIHELRAAGHKKRFMDDIGRLVDDLKNPKSSSKSQRRSALMELAVNLASQEWASRFIEYGFDNDLAAQFEHVNVDRIANILLCVVLMRLLQTKVPDHFTHSLLQAGVLEFLTRGLEETKHVDQLARDRGNNMSKVAQSDFIDLMESVRTSDFGAECLPERLSPRLLALKGIESLFLTHRRHGHRGAVLSPAMATTVVDLVTGADMATKTACRTTLHLALSALEAASTLDVVDAASNVWSADLLKRIASALPRILKMPKPTQGLGLRLSLNVTNGHAEHCDVFSEADTTQSIMGQIVEGFSHLRQAGEDKESLSHLDILVLALGLMINLAESSDGARESASCTKDQGLSVLVDVFVRGREKTSEAESEEEMQSNIPYGYLAALLGNMCQNGRVRELVRVRLPGQNLESLLEAISEFVQLHKQVDSQTMDGAEGNEVWAHWTERLSAVVRHLREGE